jgi:transposase
MAARTALEGRVIHVQDVTADPEYELHEAVELGKTRTALGVPLVREAAHAMFRLMFDLLAGLNGKIADLDKEIARRAREDEVSRRLMTIPRIAPISATAIAALAPPAETFATGRDFAAWLGLTPLQRLTFPRPAARIFTHKSSFAAQRCCASDTHQIVGPITSR